MAGYLGTVGCWIGEAFGVRRRILYGYGCGRDKQATVDG